MTSFEAFLRGVVMRMPGVQSVQTSMALKRVVYRTNLPLRAKKG